MKRVKKLMAMLLALAMILSLSVSALANSDVSDRTGYTDNSVTDTAVGNATNEGGIPADLVRLTMPVVPEDALNVYLDAHDLIKQSVAADAGRYEGTFTGNTHLYFRTNAESNAYSENSTALSITNKSSVPVAVQLDAKVERSDNKITFVESLDKLDDDAKKAQLYMAVQTVETSEDPDTAPTVKDTKVIAEEKVGLPTITKGGNDFNDVFNGDPIFAWGTDEKVTEEVKAELNKVIDGLVLTVESVASDSSFATSVTASGVTFDSKYVVTNTMSNAAVMTAAADAVYTISAKKGTSGSTPDYTIATITLPLKKLDTAKTATATVKKFAPNGTATLKSKIDNVANAYVVKWVGTNSANGNYQYAENDAVASDDNWKKIEFRLTGGINATSAWDRVATLAGTDGNKIKISLLWKLERYEDPVEPSATVVTKGTGKTGEEIVISYNLGAGDPRAVAVGDTIKFVDASGKAINGVNPLSLSNGEFTKEEGVDLTQDDEAVEGTLTYTTDGNTSKAASAIVTFTLKYPDAKGSLTKEVTLAVK